MRFNEKTCADSQQSRELKPTRGSLPNASVGIFICPNIIFGKDFTSVFTLLLGKYVRSGSFVLVD